MKTAALIASIALAASFAPVPVQADDAAVDMQLSLSRSSLPIFVLEADAVFGSLDVDVTWTVNGWPVNEAPVPMSGDQLLDIQRLQLSEAAVVCAEMEGRLSLYGDLGRDIEESDCVLWLPSDAPLSGPVADPRLLGPGKDRMPSAEPMELDLRSAPRR